MKICAACQKEITPQMVRHGAAISRGSSLYHRECRQKAPSTDSRAARPEAPAPWTGQEPALPAPGTSYPEIPVAVEYAGFWRRLGAHVIDSFVLNIIVFFASFAFGIGAGAFGLVEPTGVSILGGLIGAALPIVYFLAFWMRTGATPGKTAMGIRIVSVGGGHLSGGQSFVRFLGYFLSSLVFCLGYLAMLWDDESRCWHDRMAGTRVIRT